MKLLGRKSLVPVGLPGVMASWAAFAAAFALVGLAELGDKTQLLVVGLAARYPRGPVWLGATTAEALMAALAAVAGAALLGVVPLTAIQVSVAAAFVALGLYLFWKRSRPEPPAPEVRARNVFLASFALVALGELGDKTQLAILALAAATQAPGEVFAGAALALALLMGLAVLVGDRLTKLVPARILDRIVAALFVAAGVLLALDALA